MTRSKTLWVAVCASALLVAASAGVGAEEPDAIAGVELSAPDPLFAASVGVELSVTDDGQAPFLPFDAPAEDNPRRLQLELAAGGGGSPVDVSFAQRTSLGPGAEGDVAREGTSAIVRIGRGLVGERAAGDAASTYVFVASENQALTYQPGARADVGGQSTALALQDRVEVGDLSAGVTYERNGVQASLAYVERSESVRIGRHSVSQDESFAGVTLTARR